MLKHIYIKNFTIISELDLELTHGLTVITGETGAGKSIVLDALQIALGDRAESNLIRANNERCEISITFDIKANKLAQQWLEVQALDEEDECIVTRILSKDGRSRTMINRRPCTLQQVRELGNFLVQIHGQHQHQALLKNDHQRELLDDFSAHPDICHQVRKLYQQWHDINDEISKLKNSTQDQSARIDLIQYQLTELNQLALKDNELSELEQEHRKLANAEQIIYQTNQALNFLSDNEENSSLAHLYDAQQQIQMLSDKHATLSNAGELINNAIIQIEEAADELRNYLDHLEINPERLQEIEQRLTIIHDVARKHHVQPEQLLELQQRLQQQLQGLLHSGERISYLEQQLQKLYTEYLQVASQLTASRQKAAKKLAKLISEQIRPLGMPNAELKVELQPLSNSQPAPHGLERIEFLVNTNPGQTLQPLSKVASGGELSRIALAIQVVTAQTTGTPTLIFDEVDVGISGGTAEIVGKLLKSLGDKAQVLCITHLAQVASQGHQHLHVQKITSKQHTETTIKLLSPREKIDEIARMLGGVKITDRTLAHAKEMLGL